MIISTIRAALHASSRSFRSVLGPVWKHVGVLIGLEIIFNTFIFMVVAPVVASLTARLIATHGTVAVSNFEIKTFLLTPAGVALLVTTGVVAIVSLYIHLGAISMVVLGAATNRRVTMVGVFLGTLRRLPQLIGVSAFELLLGAIAIAPLGLIGVFAFKRLMTGHDIYFYLSTRPPAFWMMLGIAVILGVAAALIALTLAVRWIFTAIAVLVEHRGPIDAMRRSVQLARPVWRRIFAAVIVWIVAIAILSTILAIVLWFVERLGFAIAGQSTGRLIAIIGALLTLQVVGGIIVGFFAQNGLGIVIAKLYQERAQPEDMVALADAAWLEPDDRRPRRIGPLLTAGAVVLLGLTSWVCIQIGDRVELDVKTQVVAHRGSSLRAPENTLAAIRAAIEDGADVVEIDVQETADGEIVVLHDKDLTRVTGVRRNIWEVTLGEIRGLEAGAWFAPEFAGEPIPTLAECIDVCRGRIKLLIELKYNGHDVALADRVLDIVEAEGIADACLFMSLEMRGIDDVKARAPEIPCGLVVGSSIGDISRLDVDFVAIGQRNLDQITYEALLSAEMPIWVWTVNDRPGMLRFLARDIEGLITDEPAISHAIREELREMDTPERMILAFRYRLAL